MKREITKIRINIIFIEIVQGGKDWLWERNEANILNTFHFLYMTCMCGFDHVNWSGKIEFSHATNQ